MCLPDLGPASTYTVPPGYLTADALHSTRGETGEEPGPPGASAAGDDGEVLPGISGWGANSALVAGGKRGKTNFYLLGKKKKNARDEMAS